MRGSQPSEARRRRVYVDMGVDLPYDPTKRKLVIESHPACAAERVGGATATTSTPPWEGWLTDA